MIFFKFSVSFSISVFLATASSVFSSKLCKPASGSNQTPPEPSPTAPAFFSSNRSAATSKWKHTSAGKALPAFFNQKRNPIICPVRSAVKCSVYKFHCFGAAVCQKQKVLFGGFPSQKSAPFPFTPDRQNEQENGQPRDVSRYAIRPCSEAKYSFV